MTSNPSIFSKSIAETDEYDDLLTQFLREGKDIDETYLSIAINDIQAAADLFRPIYDETKGEDGYVSLEVSPHLAYDTKATIEQARMLFKRVNRKNVMIKIPATKEGLPAIEQMIAEGININITLIFSIERYQAVTQAYLSGLEKLLKSGKPLDSVRSVASVFVSRLDTKVDKLLATKGIQELQGKAAVANVKLLYQKFKEIFASPRFKALEAKGAHLQRPLWGSTSTKNPAYRDVLYVEELIGPHTVNTIPPETFNAFRDHGKAALTIEKDLDQAKKIFQDLAKAGIDLGKVSQELEDEGVKSFSDAFDQLLSAIGKKKEKIRI